MLWQDEVWNPDDRRRPRLLLAEDDDAVRTSLHALLSLDGYDVAAVPDGASLVDHLARALLTEDPASLPEAIVTDVRMPGFNAVSVMEGLRAEGWKLPIVVISAFGDDELRARVADLGNATFFDKPLDTDRLERALEAATMTRRIDDSPR